MKAIRWHGPRDLRLVEIPKPVPAPGEVLLRIESVGVCGSDIHYYVEGRIGSQVLTEPVILGHEFAGIVEALGRGANPALEGRRVAVEPGAPCGVCEWCRRGRYNVCRAMRFPGGPGCEGALCEYVAVRAESCFPVPDSIDAPMAALIEPVAVALHTIELAKLSPGDTVAVIGLGSIGLMAAQIAEHSGASVVYGADLLPYRVAAAGRYGVAQAFQSASGGGADGVVERIWDATRGRGVDVAVDCTSTSDGLGIACRVTRPGGRCVLTGISGQDWDPLPVCVARRRELNLQWCRRFCHNFPAALAMVAAGTVDVRGLLTHSFPLERTQDAFALVAASADNVLKASIDR